jgi:hypothetical protein
MPQQSTLPAAEQGSFLKFSSFRRVEDAAKGSSKPTVWGIATFEQPDLDNEICHYDTAKAVYTDWSSKAAARTAKAGQGVSYGNIRLQHGIEVGGKATKIEFDDENRQIWLGSEPINEDIHKQLKEGFYTGYSQGGSYAWRKCSECDSTLPLKQRDNYCTDCKKSVVVLYGLSSLVEVSYVDTPCIDEGFEHVKSNGSRELIKFKRKEGQMAKTKRVAGEVLTRNSFAYVGDPDKPSTWKYATKFTNVAMAKNFVGLGLARVDKDKSISEVSKGEIKTILTAEAAKLSMDEAALAEYTKLPQAIIDRVDKAAAEKGFRKGLYMVGCMAETLQSLGYLYRESVYERDVEGDDSDVPELIAANLDALVETFLAMAEEEARELAASVTSNKTTTGDTVMTPEELQKQQEAEKAAKKALAVYFAKTANDHEKLENQNNALANEHTALATAHKAALDAIKTVEVAEGETVSVAQKAAEAFHTSAILSYEKLAKSFTKTAATHKTLADHSHSMSKSYDEEQHTATIEEIKKAENAAGTAEVPVVNKNASSLLDSDVAAAAEAQRTSPEYKKAVADIAKSMIESELEEIRKKTLAPDGVKLNGAGSAALGKGVSVVARTEANSEFEFAASATSSHTAGL